MAKKEIYLNQVRVKNVMNHEILFIDSKENISKAAQIMWSKEVDNLLVLNDGLLRGVLTSLDLANIVIQLFTGKSQLSIEEYVSSNSVITISSDASLKTAMEVMSQSSLHQLPVTESDDIVGTISYSDIINYIVHSNTNGS